MRRFGAALVVTVFASMAGPAWGSGPPIEWTAPRECPDARAVKVAMEGLLLEASDTQRPQWHTRGQIRRLPAGGYRLTLEIGEGDGATEAHSLDAADCELLAQTAALLTAMRFDPIRTVDGVRRRKRPAGSVEPVALTVVAAGDSAGPPPPRDSDTRELEIVAAPEPPPRRRTTARFAFGIGAAGAWGGVPGVGAGLVANAGVAVNRARIEATLAYFPRREALYAEPVENVGARVELIAAGIAGCGVPRVKKFEFPLCVGVELGPMTGVGIGITQPERDTYLWAAATAGASVLWMPSRIVGFRAGADLVVPMRRPVYSVAGLPVLYEVPPAGVRFGAKLEVRAP